MRALGCFALLALAGCSSSGTFVLVDLDGSGLPALDRVELAATFAGRTQNTTLHDAGGVTLPTTAAIQIKSGSGPLSVEATAFDAGGNVVAQATGSTTVSAGHTVTLALSLAGGDSDLGGTDFGEADMVTPPDLGPPPAVPTGLTACPSSTHVKLTYAVPINAAGINVYYGTTAGVTRANGVKLAGSLTPPFSVPSLTNGTQYFFVVTAVSATGAESAESTEVSAKPQAAVHDTLFVPTAGGNAVDIWDCASTLATDSGPTRTLNPATLNNPQYGSAAVDAARGILYVNVAGTVLVFDDATNVKGTTAASRTITVASSFRGIAVDSTARRLYVNTSAPSTQVIANSDTASGTPTPAATITGIGGLNALTVDTTNNRLYIANNNNILCFANANGLTGTVAASSASFTWTITGGSGLYFGVSIDGNIMYSAFYNPGAVDSVANITAQASGALTAATSLTAAAHAGPLTVANNVMYFAPDNDATNRVFIYNNASTATGAKQPDKVFVAPAAHTSLSQALYIP
jgi:hypothetical protein